MPEPDLAKPEEPVIVPAAMVGDERRESLKKFVADAVTDLEGRELVERELWRITVRLPPTLSVTGEADLGHPVSIEVSVIEGKVELDEPDPPIETSNGQAWDCIEKVYGPPIALRLVDGKPRITDADGGIIPDQEAERYGTRPEVSPTDLIRWLEQCPESTKLSDDAMTRLRKHLNAPVRRARLQNDPNERKRRAKLQNILDYNEGLRRHTLAGPAGPVATTPAAASETPPPTAKPTHSPDFRSITWYGPQYFFTAAQAAVVKVLWEAWEARTPDVGGDTLLEAIGSEGSRLVDIFRGQPAWGTVIVEGETKGARRLAEPKKPPNS